MKITPEVDRAAEEPAADDGRGQLEPLLSRRRRTDSSGVVLGQLVGLRDDGHTALVVHPGQQESAALAARTTVDIHGSHIGRSVVLVFEHGDPMKPIVLGVLLEQDAPRIEFPPGQVAVDADGARLVVSAREQLVLRCGKASVTLTRDGKVLIEGAYISSRSSGVNRVKGGSVQLN